MQTRNIVEELQRRGLISDGELAQRTEGAKAARDAGQRSLSALQSALVPPIPTAADDYERRTGVRPFQSFAEFYHRRTGVRPHPTMAESH